MDMIACTKSSQICEYGYDADTKTLGLRFKNGGLYHYSGVPQETFDGLKEAESIGSFLHENVKGKFRFERIGAGGLGQIETAKRKT